MKIRHITILLLFGIPLMLITAPKINAQSSINHHLYLNANVGLAQAHSDIQEHENHISKLPNETDLAYGVKLAKYISPTFALYAEYIMGKTKGQRRRRDAYYTGEFQNAGLGLTMNFSNLFWGVNKRRGIHIYGAAGIGLNYYYSHAKYMSDNSTIASFGYDINGTELTKGTPASSIDIPIGIGMTVNVSKNFQLNLESKLHLLEEDNFDAFSSGEKKDAYYYTSLGLTYNFWKKKDKEPEIDEPIFVTIPDSVITAYDNIVGVEVIVPDTILSNSEIQVNCKLTKADLGGKAELMQILPIGFNITDTVFDGADRFEFENYTLHLFWEDLPADSVIDFSYNVQLDNIHGYLPMSSVLYFNEIDREYSYESNLFITKELPEPAIADTIITELPADTLIADTQDDLKDIEYRVQIRAAYKAMIPLSHLAKRYHITDSIQEDFVDNWYRYSIGSFGTYSEAKEYRDIIINDHGVHDAFIVAFKNGVRLNSLSELKELPVHVPDIPKPINTVYDESGSYFRVQIMALEKNRIDPQDLAKIYHIDEEINEEVYDDWRRYTIGGFKSITDAKAMKQKMIDAGINDAFIVAYINGERFKVIIDK